MVPFDRVTARRVLVWRGLVATARTVSARYPGAATADPDDIVCLFRGVGPDRRGGTLRADCSAAHPGRCSPVVDTAGIPRRAAAASLESASYRDVVFCP